MVKRALVADIGGTNARFALADPRTLAVSLTQSFRVADFATIVDASRAFLEATGERPETACFAVAAPIAGDEIVFTNSHWRFRPDELRGALNLKRFRPVNDFYALASSIEHLSEDYFADIRLGVGDPAAPMIVIGPGTGFGQALIVPCGAKRRIVSTQGGHSSFAPQTDEEFAVRKFIARETSRVSNEQILSGPGLVNIHRALSSLIDAPVRSVSADEITAAANGGGDLIAVKTVDMFFRVLGRVVGDAVLATGARGGVVLGGGILPNIKDKLGRSAFVEAFLDKGPMRIYVEVVPIRLIVQKGAELIGAAAALREGA